MKSWISMVGFIALEIVAASWNPSTSHAQGTLADYQRASEVIAKVRPADVMLNGALDPHWIGATHRLWYLRHADGGAKEFIQIDSEKGERAPAFDHARLAKALATTAEGGPSFESTTLPFDFIEFS